MNQDHIDQVIVDLRCKQSKVIKLEGHLDFGFTGEWHPQQTQYLATGNQDLTVRLWDIRQPSHSIVTLHSNTSAVYTLHFTYDGKYLLCPETIDRLKVYSFYSHCLYYQSIDYIGQAVGIASTNDAFYLAISMPEYNQYQGIIKYTRNDSQSLFSIHL